MVFNQRFCTIACHRGGLQDFALCSGPILMVSTGIVVLKTCIFVSRFAVGVYGFDLEVLKQRGWWKALKKALKWTRKKTNQDAVNKCAPSATQVAFPPCHIAHVYMRPKATAPRSASALHHFVSVKFLQIWLYSSFVFIPCLLLALDTLPHFSSGILHPYFSVSCSFSTQE